MRFSYTNIAKELTENENCRTDTIFEDSLIGKLFVFNFINSCEWTFGRCIIAPILLQWLIPKRSFPYSYLLAHIATSQDRLSPLNSISFFRCPLCLHRICKARHRWPVCLRLLHGGAGPDAPHRLWWVKIAAFVAWFKSDTISIWMTHWLIPQLLALRQRI